MSVPSASALLVSLCAFWCFRTHTSPSHLRSYYLTTSAHIFSTSGPCIRVYMPHGCCLSLVPHACHVVSARTPRSKSHGSFPCLFLVLPEYQIPPLWHIRGVGASCIFVLCCFIYLFWTGFAGAHHRLSLCLCPDLTEVQLAGAGIAVCPPCRR